MEAGTDKGTQTLLDKRLLKVLLVEDEAIDRKSVQRILRTCSSPVEFVVEPAASLSEAIRNLAEKKYDVILLDLHLPDSSGIETVRQIVKVAPDIPVVVLSELKDEQVGFSVLEEGATDYLVKDLPLDIMLVRTIIYALQRKKIQMLSLKLTHDVNEHMKELNCLYGISKVANTPGISLEEILEKIVCLLPAGWQYPGIACARIVIDDKEYKTDNFKPSKWTQSADITLQGQKVGTVEVCYEEERPQSDEGPFLREERDLIDAIGERLGEIALRIKTTESLRESEERYKNLFKANI
ncbi:MAG: response regulator transcription factor [Sedimentisphaerales bacterium]|jgi:DNA-binding NarL/FixJ family response regulator